MPVLAVGPAGAHTGGDPAIRLTLDDLPPALDGVVVEVVDRLAPQLVLANPTDRRVEVLGADGRPFLRIGPDGVEGNLAVAEWTTTNDPAGAAVMPEGVGGPDRWGRVAEDPSWGWYDHRLHPGTPVVPQAIAEVGQPARIGTWAVPLRVDGQPAVLTGEIRYEPLRGLAVAALEEAPAVDGLQVAVLPGAVPGLFVQHRGAGVVTLLGRDGEPFLRIDPDRGVEANLRSPSWIDSARAASGGSPAEVVDAAAEPAWQVVADTPSFSWIDPRLALPGREPDPAVVAAARPAVVQRWQIPVRVAGGPDAEIAGTITWQPDPALAAAAEGSPPSTSWVGVGAVAGLALAGAVWARRPRRAGPRPIS